MSRLALLLLLPLLLAARAPKPRPLPVRPSVVGEWLMLWHNAEYRTAFAPGGYYETRYRGCTDLMTVGRWTLTGHVLRVEEWPVSSDAESGPLITWTVTLRPGQLSGECVSDRWGSRGEFWLRPFPSQ